VLVVGLALAAWHTDHREHHCGTLGHNIVQRRVEAIHVVGYDSYSDAAEAS
jgi:hypothetical protein